MCDFKSRFFFGTQTNKQFNSAFKSTKLWNLPQFKENYKIDILENLCFVANKNEFINLKYSKLAKIPDFTNLRLLQVIY